MPSNIARGADRRPQPRHPPGSRQGGRYAPNAVADRPSPAPGAGLSFAARSSAPLSAELLWALPEEPHPGLPVRAGPRKLVLWSIPRPGHKRRRSTISRPDGPNALWENRTPFSSPLVRSMRENWDLADMAIELPAQVAVELLNSGDADPADPECMEAIRFGVSEACAKWETVGGAFWSWQYTARGMDDIRKGQYKWALAAAAAAAKADRYLLDHRHQLSQLGRRVDEDSAPQRSWTMPLDHGWWNYGVFDHGVWQGADGRLLERMAADCNADGEDALFRPHDDRGAPAPWHVDLLGHLALGVLALDPPPCRRVYADAIAHLKKGPASPDSSAGEWWGGRPLPGMEDSLDRAARDIALARAIEHLPPSHPIHGP